LSIPSELITNFQKETGVVLRRDVLGARHTTFAIGGPIQVLIEPDSEEEMKKALQFLSRYKQRFNVLGAGSNLLMPDAGVSGWVIRAGKGLRYCHETGRGEFAVGAAMSLMTLSRNLSVAGLSGLEFAGGIPASLGGAVRMNAGAHGGQMADCIEEVTIINSSGEVIRLQAPELEFSYRSSSLPPDAVVIEARISLKQSDPEKAAALRAVHLAERKKRQPLTSPSGGSVFKNPSKEQSAGALLEGAGLKGCCIGGAKVSDLHANWIINDKRTACFADVKNLITYCQERVLKESGVKLECELVSFPESFFTWSEREK